MAYKPWFLFQENIKQPLHKRFLFIIDGSLERRAFPSYLKLGEPNLVLVTKGKSLS